MSNATVSPVVWTATVEDLWKVEGKAELVDGRLVRMSPAGGIHSDVVREILVRLHAGTHRQGRGRAYGDNAGFVVNLPNRRSFAPDVAFYVGPPSGEGFLVGPPILAVEVRSPEDFGPDAEDRLARKRSDYFAAGTLVVWDVDPLRDRVVRVYRADARETAHVFAEDDLADAEPAVPGWRVRVADILPPLCSSRPNDAADSFARLPTTTKGPAA